MKSSGVGARAQVAEGPTDADASRLVLRDFATSLADLVHHSLDPDLVRDALGRLASSMGAEEAALYIGETEALQLLSSAGAADPSAPPAMEPERQAAAVEAVESLGAVLHPAGSGAALAAPVMAGGRVMGAVCLARVGGSFPAPDGEILTAFAQVLGAGLRRNRMEAQLSDQLKRLEGQDFRLFTINHVARVLGSVLDLDELLRLISDMVCEIVHAEVAVLCLMQDEDGMLGVRSAKALDGRRRVPDFEMHLSESFQEWIRGYSGKVNLILAADDPEVERTMPALAEQFRRHALQLFTPMLYKDRLIGIVAVGRKYTGEPYDERDREFLSTLAPLASNAIANAQLYDMAIHDSTTGLYVSHYFRRRVVSELKRSRRYGYPVSVAMFDLDYFKQVNDTYGHLTGDQVLREVGHLLRRSSRQDIDVAARYGGEEFVVVLPETPQDGAVVVAERIRRSVEDYLFCGGRIRLTASGGVATFPDDAKGYEELLDRADVQLYRAKRAGRNRIFAADTEFLMG